MSAHLGEASGEEEEDAAESVSDETGASGVGGDDDEEPVGEGGSEDSESEAGSSASDVSVAELLAQMATEGWQSPAKEVSPAANAQYDAFMADEAALANLRAMGHEVDVVEETIERATHKLLQEALKLHTGQHSDGGGGSHLPPDTGAVDDDSKLHTSEATLIENACGVLRAAVDRRSLPAGALTALSRQFKLVCAGSLPRASERVAFACIGVVLSRYPNTSVEFWGMRIGGALLRHGTATVFMRGSARAREAWKVETAPLSTLCTAASTRASHPMPPALEAAPVRMLSSTLLSSFSFYRGTLFFSSTRGSPRGGVRTKLERAAPFLP
jgi:hypothetical protein